MRVSILVCTPDSSTPRFQKCYRSILATTKGKSYDLRIVDNRHTDKFSQQREINKAIAIADGPVINLDDDTEMLAGWYECLLDHYTSDTGLLCCNTADRSEISESMRVPVTGLCCALLNPGILTRGATVDEAYAKYFFDHDLCLRIWECGMTVSVVPSQIIHNSGGGVREMGLNRMALYSKDKIRFRETWIDSGRYSAIESTRLSEWNGRIRKSLYV